MARKKVEEQAKLYLVETPVPNYCGIGAAGVQFAYGKAEVREGWVLDWYRAHGYKVTELGMQEQAELEEPAEQKDDM